MASSGWRVVGAGQIVVLLSLMVLFLVVRYSRAVISCSMVFAGVMG